MAPNDLDSQLVKKEIIRFNWLEYQIILVFDLTSTHLVDGYHARRVRSTVSYQMRSIALCSPRAGSGSIDFP
jgi:hypothetical protein